MKLSDYFGFAVFVGFGLWWVVFPMSVVNFYSWFHRGRVKMPGTFGVRLAGVLWVLLVSIVMAITFAKR
jgi:succinate-acetate transporter protein